LVIKSIELDKQKQAKQTRAQKRDFSELFP
jgi:hypothetical protein